MIIRTIGGAVIDAGPGHWLSFAMVLGKNRFLYAKRHTLRTVNAPAPLNVQCLMIND